MKTNLTFAAAALAVASFATGAVAQSAAPAASQPAPTPAVSPASPMPAPNSIIYIPRLPSPAELSNAAAAQGLTIEKMEQTSDHITVVYRYASGQTNTIAYQLLSTAGAVQGPVATTTVVPAPTTTVIYRQPYYYDPFYSSWGWPWYAPVSIGLGFDFHGGHYYGGGGFRHFGGRGGWGGRGGRGGFHH